MYSSKETRSLGWLYFCRKRAYHIVEKTEGKNNGADHVAHHSSITTSTSHGVEQTARAATENIAGHAEVETLQIESERDRSFIRVHLTLPSSQENDCVLSFHFRCRRRSAKNTSVRKRCRQEFWVYQSRTCFSRLTLVASSSDSRSFWLSKAFIAEDGDNLKIEIVYHSCAKRDPSFRSMCVCVYQYLFIVG